MKLDPNWIEKMRKASRLAASTLEMIEPYVKAGVTTDELNTLCHDYMVSFGAKPAPLGYKGFPKSICTSPNHVICHGIPNDKPLKNGDILNIDVSLSLEGAYADTCKMFFVGQPSPMAARIVKCAQECIYKAIAQVAPGLSLRTIGKTIEEHAKTYKYSVVRDFCGHGVGVSLHTEPQIVHYDDKAYEHEYLKEGLTFTIEPMINVGKPGVSILSDGWTAVTRDRSLSAQFEHTLLVTATGVEILTLRNDENLEAIMAYKQQK